MIQKNVFRSSRNFRHVFVVKIRLRPASTIHRDAHNIFLSCLGNVNLCGSMRTSRGSYGLFVVRIGSTIFCNRFSAALSCRCLTLTWQKGGRSCHYRLRYHARRDTTLVDPCRYSGLIKYIFTCWDDAFLNLDTPKNLSWRK